MTNPQVSAPTSYHKSKSREAVLIVAHGDGWLKAFAEKHVDVRIEIMPYMTTPEGQILAEEYLENKLPWRYRQLFWPGNRRATEMVRKITPDDIAQMEWKRALFDSITEAGRILRGEDEKGGSKIWIA